MSGIYILGMEMPRNCRECPLVQPNDSYNCAINKKSYSWGLSGRPTDCPLIPVRDHGRLIDADALKQRAGRGTDEHGRPCMLIKLGYVNTMPTIIPADKDATMQSNTSNALDALKTNADRIRAMTDDELAELLAGVADWTFSVDYGHDAGAWYTWLKHQADKEADTT